MLVRDTEYAERDVLMENPPKGAVKYTGEVPILHELRGVHPGQFIGDRSFLSVGTSPTDRKVLSL